MTPESTHFDLRPAATQKWIADLPLGSTGETSKQLYHVLRQINQQDNHFQHHLQFLESISPTLHMIYPRLAHYFTDVALPLNKKTRNVLHITQALLKEMLQGYEQLAADLLKRKPFGWKKPFAQILHRSLLYRSQLFCTFRLTYQPYPQQTWQRVYWCYQQAEQSGLLNKKFVLFDDSKGKTSVDYEFKKLLLLSLLSANDLGQKNMQQVYELMPAWIKHCDLQKNEPDDKKTCFVLDMASDNPPFLVGTHNPVEKKNPNLRFLNTSKLNNLLHSLLEKVADNDSVQYNKKTLSRLTINGLMNTWSRQHLRTHLRKEGHGFVDIITTISGIHFVLNQQDQPAYDESSHDLPDVVDFESTLTIEPIKTPKSDTLNLSHFLGATDEEEDVWGQVYTNTINETLPKTDWTESGMFRSYQFTRSILLDYSDYGYRLSVNPAKVDSLKHNELVAVREHALAPWALAQIKWLHFGQKADAQFGLYILGHHVLPIHVRYQIEHGMSKPLPCLLGLDQKKLMLFIPTLPTNLNGRKLELQHQKQYSSIHLKHKIYSTSAFDVYEIFDTAAHEKKTLGEKAIVENPRTEQLADGFWQNF